MVVFLKSRSVLNGSAGPPSLDVPQVVRGVIDDIRANGDDAVRTYSQKFDKWSPESFKLSPEQVADIIATVSEQTIADIKTVQNNVRTFALAQRKSLTDFELEIRPGVFLGQKNIPIGAVGAYVPSQLSSCPV